MCYRWEFSLLFGSSYKGHVSRETLHPWHFKEEVEVPNIPMTWQHPLFDQQGIVHINRVNEFASRMVMSNFTLPPLDTNLSIRVCCRYVVHASSPIFYLSFIIFFIIWLISTSSFTLVYTFNRNIMSKKLIYFF